MADLTCGPDCPTPDATHADPEWDWIGDHPLAHGESERTVPGTGGWNGVYTESPDPYCLCGHPDYVTCPRRLTEGIFSLEIVSAVGGDTPTEEDGHGND